MRCSLDLTDESIIRDPTRTTSPPISDGSTAVSDPHLRPDRFAQGLGKPRLLVVAERRCARHIGRLFAAPPGQHGKIGVDHPAQREQAPVVAGHTDEAADQVAGAGPLQDRHHGAGLRLAADQRGTNQPAQVVALFQQGFQPAQVIGHGVELFRLVRHAVQRRRVPLGEAAGMSRFRRQNPMSRSTACDEPSAPERGRLPWILVIFAKKIRGERAPRPLPDPRPVRPDFANTRASEPARNRRCVMWTQRFAGVFPTAAAARTASRTTARKNCRDRHPP